MHNNVATPIINFNLKILFFQYFHEHTNSKLNQFLSILKEANFRVLQILSGEMLQWYSVRLRNILHEHTKYQQ
jgi:hypothetical protein